MVTIQERSWVQFRDIITFFIEEIGNDEEDDGGKKEASGVAACLTSKPLQGNSLSSLETTVCSTHKE